MSNKKQRDSAAADAEILAKRHQADAAAMATVEPATQAQGELGATPDVLGEQEDTDVIF